MGLNKLLLMNSYEKFGRIRALKKKRRRDRLEKAARRRARDQTAGDNPSGRAGSDRLKVSMPTSAPKGRAPGDDHLKVAAGSVPSVAGSETVRDDLEVSIRRAAVRRLGHLRWDV